MLLVSDDKVQFIKIKIYRYNQKVIQIVLPIIYISIILFLLPEQILNKWKEDNINIKKLLKDLKYQGKGTKILVSEDSSKIKIELK
mgnify:FL=1